MELRGVGHHHHLARDLDHDRVELRLEHVGGHEADLGVEAVHPQEESVGVEPAQGLLGVRAREGIGHLAEDPPDHDEAHVREVGELHGDVERVRDHVQGLELQELDLPGDLGGGGPRVEHDGLAVADHLAGGVADAHLLRVVQGLLDRDGHVFRGGGALQGPAVGAHHGSRVGQGVEVAADGDRGDREAGHQLVHGHPLLRLQEVHDAPPPFLDQQPGRLRLHHGVALL